MKTSNFYFLVLDIETSAYKTFNYILKKEVPNAVWLSYGYCKLYNNKGKGVRKCYFRDWKDLQFFLQQVSMAFYNTKIFCYVHNLSYEFDYLIKNLSLPSKFCCNSTHKVISATLEDYYNIEFRCTYQLSSKSLRKIGEEIELAKLESDYRNILPNEEVTETEKEYCERDCDIVAKYVVQELKEYGLLYKLPLTNTGRVRKKLAELIKEYPCDFEWDKLPPEDCFDAMCKAFKGAITMSNPEFTGKLIDKPMRCFDETSKYPGTMMAYKFPYKIKKLETFSQDEYKKHKFWIAKVRFINVCSKYQWGCLSKSTCEEVSISADIFNGKIINAYTIVSYITNVDLEYIQKTYNIDSMYIEEFYSCYEYDYLPEFFYKLIEMFAKPKYELKIKLKKLEKEGKENTEEYKELSLAYMKSKNMLNAIYGMMVQKLTNSEFYIDDLFVWHKKDGEYKQTDKHIKRNFLYGIFITAYSRRDLILNIIHNCPYTFVYCDTDSIKFIDENIIFEDLNIPIREDYRNKAWANNFNRFDEDPSYQMFITYGAKKYCYTLNDKFHFTIAGLPKSNNGIETPLKSFDDFRLGAEFVNCKKCTRYIYNGKYIDLFEENDEDMIISDMDISTINYLNENNIKTNGGVALLDVNYKLNMTVLDLSYIKKYYNIWKNNYDFALHL